MPGDPKLGQRAGARSPLSSGATCPCPRRRFLRATPVSFRYLHTTARLAGNDGSATLSVDGGSESCRPHTGKTCVIYVDSLAQGTASNSDSLLQELKTSAVKVTCPQVVTRDTAKGKGK